MGHRIERERSTPHPDGLVEPTSAYQIAHDSYERCLRAPDFFEGFYEVLLDSNDVIRPMFADTEFPRQHRLLQHGLGLLFIYAKRQDAELLERIANRHSSDDIDVPPELYPYFVDSLVHAVSRSDPEFGSSIEEAWREVVRPGIDYMKSKYVA